MNGENEKLVVDEKFKASLIEKHNNRVFKNVKKMVGDDVVENIKKTLKPIKNFEKYKISMIGFVPINKKIKEKVSNNNKKIISFWAFCRLNDNEKKKVIKPNVVLNFDVENLKDKKLMDFYEKFSKQNNMFLINDSRGYYMKKDVIKINDEMINWEEKLKKGTKIYKREKENIAEKPKSKELER